VIVSEMEFTESASVRPRVVDRLMDSLIDPIESASVRRIAVKT
jgi:hypothetical protein